ncbi:cysteine proteinase [Pholiota conissans]|uniref:ubiquitinyl hydrolase 1 n=1 Tax=Pholiota conissans TaxID=109636 RepID=A0A9P5Z6Z3_9AGAR|nr:cysteine proteinase [Pholiota conissans]
MQSDSGASSSSVKRSVADNSSNEIQIRSPRPDQTSALTSTDLNQDIDAYMADQGEADIPQFMPPTPSLSETTSAAPMRSLREKLSRVQSGKGRKMQIGETWYLVSARWYKRFVKACTGEVDKAGPVNEEDLGPVNNSSLLDSYGNLLPSLAEGVDVEYVPQEVWDELVDWYGAALPLPRRVIARGAARLPSLELRPLRLKSFRLVKAFTSTSNPPHPWVQISAGETISTLCGKLADSISPGSETRSPYRIWRIAEISEDQGETDFLGSQLLLSEGRIVEESTKTLEEEGIESDDAFVVEFKQANGWIVQAPKTPQKLTVVESSRPLFNSNEGFFNKMSATITPVTTTTATYKPSVYDGLTTTTLKSTSSALALASKASAKIIEVGTLGLGNMGNTCFMNSALQCLAHNQELTEYFLTGVYKDELNRDNPLGMGGAIAEAFGSLLQRIWSPTGTATSYSPRDFKTQLQRFAPQFNGYQQHDSQELVAFLLDGLHEDLNRVLKKPYVEKPDWEGGGDLELVKLAQNSWEGYMLRNDSVIVDLFQGQYRSTLVCPECQKVSITFDPFMYLTLPLPIQKKWTHTVFYIPWDLDKPHLKIPVEINRDASFKDLKALVGRWMGANPDNLLTMEVFNHRFYKNLDESVPVGDMSDNDTVVCFELPCNARQSRSYKAQRDDTVIVPVFLWDAKPPQSTSGSYFQSRPSSATPFGYPMIVAIDQETASDVNTLYEFITERLRRWTAHARDLFAWEMDDDAKITEVPIHVNAFPPIESITEFTEDGKVITIHATPPPEGDIVDEKQMIVDEEDADAHSPLHKVGAKKDVFNLRLQVNHKDFGTTSTGYPTSNRWESWDNRLKDAEAHPVLLREHDALYCEFDEDKKAYFFGESPKFEHALWNDFDTFTHPEFTENQKANAAKRHKGISLQDCLDEFTKEEQLGEDDLWYCPQCKKHQQATKKFDLWKVPDILVVHLKRFSNSRALRDKIDAHVEFPIEGLDLGDMAGERNVAKRLLEEGVNIEELKLGNLDEPLIYDLFGVDEHIGGLGGGHYRAYAHNHVTDNWYHFDDSYVTVANPAESVNANAYLLFYRRRTRSHLGGKSFQKTQEAKSQPRVEPEVRKEVVISTQLPTPPNESSDFASSDRLPFFTDTPSGITLHESDSWNLRSNDSNAGSSVPSPPTDDPPEFDDYANSYNNDPLILSSQRYDFPDPSNKASPTSSNEVELDTELDQEVDWESSLNNFSVGVTEVRTSDWDEVSNRASPSYSQSSDSDPFNDANNQKEDSKITNMNHEFSFR